MSCPFRPTPAPRRIWAISPLLLGVCVAEAKEQQKPLAHHLQHLCVHGALHLIGFDHEDEAEAEEMEALERLILARLNVPDPYA